MAFEQHAVKLIAGMLGWLISDRPSVGICFRGASPVTQWMDDAHLRAAVRHMESNPAAAKMVKWAENYRWSNGLSHIAGERMRGTTRLPM